MYRGFAIRQTVKSTCLSELWGARPNAIRRYSRFKICVTSRRILSFPYPVPALILSDSMLVWPDSSTHSQPTTNREFIYVDQQENE